MIRSFNKRSEQKISGFQSPAADYLEGRLDIANHIIVDPHSIFYFQMKGKAMQSTGIFDGDILIVDRSLLPTHGAIIIAFIEGTFTCQIYLQQNNQVLLKNDEGSIKSFDTENLEVWGVVTAVCRNVLPALLKTGRYKNVCTM